MGFMERFRRRRARRERLRRTCRPAVRRLRRPPGFRRPRASSVSAGGGSRRAVAPRSSPPGPGLPPIQRAGGHRTGRSRGLPPSAAGCPPGRTRRSWAPRPTRSWTGSRPLYSAGQRPRSRPGRCRASNATRAHCRWRAATPSCSGPPRYRCGRFPRTSPGRPGSPRPHGASARRGAAGRRRPRLRSPAEVPRRLPAAVADPRRRCSAPRPAVRPPLPPRFRPGPSRADPLPPRFRPGPSRPDPLPRLHPPCPRACG